LFHVTANNCLAHAMTTLGGGKLVHMYKWDAGDALALIEREKDDQPDRRAGHESGVNYPSRLSIDTTPRASFPSEAAARNCNPTSFDKIDRSVHQRSAQHRLWHDRNLRHHHLRLAAISLSTGLTAAVPRCPPLKAKQCR
jgi:hypothetical protein